MSTPRKSLCAVPMIMRIPTRPDQAGNLLASDYVELSLHDIGAGVFLGMRCANIEPDDEFPAGMACVTIADLRDIIKIAENMLATCADVEGDLP